MDFDVFEKMLVFLFRSYPGATNKGVIPADVTQTYWQILKEQEHHDMKQAFRAMLNKAGSFPPSAAELLASCKKFSVDRDPLNYHNELSSSQVKDPGSHDFQKLPPPDHQNGLRRLDPTDGLPSCSRDIPPQVGRKSSHYSDAAHAATDHFLDLIRAMKFKGFSGGEMADKFISEMNKQGPQRYKSPHTERIKKGFIVNAADATCLAFADMLDDIESGKLHGDTEPHDIGGRLFWTFAGKQKSQINRRIVEVREKRDRERKKAKEQAQAQETKKLPAPPSGVFKHNTADLRGRGPPQNPP